MMEELLVFNGSDIKISMFEKKILAALEDIILNKLNVAVCYPNQHFFPFLVLHTVLKDYIENYKYRKDFTKRISVLAITNKKKFLNYLENTGFIYSQLKYKFFEKHKFFRDRGVFCDLNDSYYAQCNWNHILNDYYNGKIPEIIPLDFILPIAIGYFNFRQLNRGIRNKIGRKDNKQRPVFYITDNINILKNMEFKADYIFIDYTYTRKFLNFVPNGVLYYFDTPIDDRLIYLLNKVQLWNFDAKLLSHLPKGTIEDKIAMNNNEYSIQDLVKARDVSNVHIIYVKSEFENEIAKGLDLLNQLSKKKFDPYDLKIIASLLYSAIRMPISATEYDLIAELEIAYDPINELLNELRESDNRYEDEDFEKILILIEDIFYKKGLDKKSPKFEEMENLLISEINQGKRVGIVVSNKIVSLALKEQLSLTLQCSIDDLKSKGVYFYDKKGILEGIEKVDCDCLIMYSAINLEDLRILELCNYKKAMLYLYKVEMLSLEIKLKKLENTDNHSIELIDSRTKPLTSMYRYFYNRIKHFIPRDDTSRDFVDIISEINQENEKSTSIRKKRMYKGKNAVKARLVEFTDESYMFINGEFRAKVLNRRAKKYEMKKYSDLKNGDELLFIDNDVRRELFEVFIDYMDQSEKSIKCYHLIQKWRQLYEEKFYNSRLTDEQLYKRMKNNGWDKITKAILKNWRSGYSYGPRDFEDIICLGQVLSIDEFINNAQLYYSAMQHVRNERRNAARILNKYIFASKAGREKILSELEAYNLSIDQLNEAVKVKRIKNIQEKVYYIKPSELGILFED